MSTQVASPALLGWAKTYVAGLNEEQRAMLQMMYDQHQAKTEQKKEEQQKTQQQAILESLSQQIPVTVDVVRSSTSPESMVSSEGGEIFQTVKDVLLGKIKNSFRQSSPGYDSKPYRPRGTRERVLFDQHLYIFDKLSYDCKKRFFRCERRNTCPARVHTPFDSDKVIHKVQIHNHQAPSPFDLANYDIDYAKIRQGHIMPVNFAPQARSTAPSSLLTPKSEIEEENLMPKLEKSTSPMEYLTSMAKELSEQKPVRLCLPDCFNRLSGSEMSEIDSALTKFLLRESDLRKELMETKGDLPIFFPMASKDELVLFVANSNEEDSIFEMIHVKERNEKSIRNAIQAHFNQISNRSLMINISGKINVPLSQQMIDQWKSEEFIRIDISKPNYWKVHHLTKIDQ